jgi:DNA-directed RNA polymerase specialized sigma24 family protein
MPGVISKIDREDLFKEVCNTLHQLPELERRIFSQAHYSGQSLEAISRSFQLEVAEVSAILKECDQRLNTSIRSLRKKQLRETFAYPCRDGLLA